MQNSIETKLLPELIANMHWASLAMMLCAHARWIDSNIPALGWAGRLLSRPQGSRTVADLVHETVETVAVVQEVILARQRVFELARALEPLPSSPSEE